MVNLNNISSYFFGLGLAFITATQLRFFNGVIGIGEIFLSFAIIISIVNAALNPSFIDKRFSIFTIFFIVGVILLCSGFFVSVIYSRESDGVRHDLFAFIFSGLFLSTLLFNVDYIMAKRILEILAIFGVLPLFFILICNEYFVSSVGMNVWLNHRFRGWANNPNQLGLFFSSLPFYLLFLLKNEILIYRYFFILALFVLSLVVGVLTFSDALYLSWVIGFSYIIITTLIRFLLLPSIDYNSAIAKSALLFLIFFLCFIFFATLSEDIYRVLLDVYTSENNQGSVRMDLWINSIYAIVQSPIVGWGAGAHSGISNSFNNYEAHNVYLDWAASTGLLGLFMLLGLITFTLYVALKHGSFLIISALLSLLAFGFFHNIMRFPIFWFYLVLPLIYSIKKPLNKNLIFQNS